MPETETKVFCDSCNKEATICLCQDCYEKDLEEEFEKGKDVGKEEAAEENDESKHEV